MNNQMMSGGKRRAAIRKSRRILSPMLILLAGVTLAGCGNIHFGSFQIGGMNDNTLLKVAEAKLPTAEGGMYLSAWKEEYENRYGASVWETGGESGRTADELKAEAAVYIQNIMAASQSAVTGGRKCTDDEENRFKMAGEQYASVNQDTDPEEAADAFRNLYLADEVYAEAEAAASAAIAPEQARVVWVKQIWLPFSDDDQKAEQKKKADKIISRIQEGPSYFNAQAAYYNEAEEIYRYVMRGDLPQDIEEAVFSLAENEVSSLQETTDGYYLFQCEEPQAEPQTTDHVNQIREETLRNTYQSTLDTFMKDNSMVWNASAWDTLKLTGEDAVSGKDFFSIYQQVVRD